jgi:hypothetical protein
MKRVMVRYRVKQERVAENEGLIRSVYEELAATNPEGLRYATFKLDDGVSFVHIASVETNDAPNPLASLAAFGRFTADVADRCEEQPVTSELCEIGSYRLFGS